jgi:hypothetical protein
MHSGTAYVGAISPEKNAEYIRILEQRTPEQKARTAAAMDRTASAALGLPLDPEKNHKYTDPSGVEWVHGGPEETCQSPDCMTMRQGSVDSGLMDIYGRTKNGGVYCEKCDTDNHRCPGCGENVPHGTVACVDCNARVDAERDRRQALCSHPDGFQDTLSVDGREVPACEHCDAVAPTSKLPPGETDDGRECDHSDGLFGVEDGKTVCVACGTPDPTDRVGPDPELPNCPHPMMHRAGCGCPDDDSARREAIDGWRTPLDLMEKMPEEIRGLDALRLNCGECGHPVTPLVDHFGPDGKAAKVVWDCEQHLYVSANPCRGHECKPDTRLLVGDLEVGEHFVRRGTVMRVTETLSGDVHAVVVEGPMKGREGVLPDNYETVERTYCRHEWSEDVDEESGLVRTVCDHCNQTKEQETTECTDDRTPQQRPASSAASTRTANPTTAPGPGSRPPTKASVPAVSPKSGSVTSSAPTARAAGNGRSAAVTTDQASAAAAFLGSARPTAPVTVNQPNQAEAAAQFLAGGSGSHGEKETDRDHWGRYLILHPDTGKEQAWTRSTTFAKSISDTYALSQWGLRMCLLGATQRPDIVQRAHGKHVKADKKLLDELTADLKNAAGDKVAANLGTSMHSFTELADRAWHSPGGPRSVMGQVPPDCRDMVETYIRLLEETGLEPVSDLIEFTVVVKQYGVAGTSDNCYKVTKPLKLKIGRAEVRLEPGEYVIGDKKTGKDLDYGWQEIAIQLATYAQGLNTCGRWDRREKKWYPDPLNGAKVRLDAGIVVHLPVDEESEKQPAVYGVDLESGWNAAVLCERVRAWRKVRSLASPVMVSEAETFAPARPEAVVKAAPVVGSHDPDTGVTDCPEPTVTTRTNVRPPSLMDKAKTVTSKSDASAVWQEATKAGLPEKDVDALVSVMQKRLEELEEKAG